MYKRIFKIAVNTVLVMLIALGALVAFSFVPIPGNYRIFTVQSGSMEPTISTGSLIFVKPLSDYAPGDIITKKTKSEKVTITHRIISREERDGQVSYQTQGDANDAPDMDITHPEQIIGKKFLSVPFLGLAVAYAKTTQGLILIVIIPAVIIVYDELLKIKEEIRKKIRYRQARRTRLNNLNIQNDEKDTEIKN